MDVIKAAVAPASDYRHSMNLLYNFYEDAIATVIALFPAEG